MRASSFFIPGRRGPVWLDKTLLVCKTVGNPMKKPTERYSDNE
jgi:hypothetical protein